MLNFELKGVEIYANEYVSSYYVLILNCSSANSNQVTPIFYCISSTKR